MHIDWDQIKKTDKKNGKEKNFRTEVKIFIIVFF